MYSSACSPSATPLRAAAAADAAACSVQLALRTSSFLRAALLCFTQPVRGLDAAGGPPWVCRQCNQGERAPGEPRVGERVRVLQGDAIATLQRLAASPLPPKFDFLFIDGVPRDGLAYLRAAEARAAASIPCFLCAHCAIAAACVPAAAGAYLRGLRGGGGAKSDLRAERRPVRRVRSRCWRQARWWWQITFRRVADGCKVLTLAPIDGHGPRALGQMVTGVSRLLSRRAPSCPQAGRLLAGRSRLPPYVALNETTLSVVT